MSGDWWSNPGKSDEDTQQLNTLVEMFPLVPQQSISSAILLFKGDMNQVTERLLLLSSTNKKFSVYFIYPGENFEEVKTQKDKEYIIRRLYSEHRPEFEVSSPPALQIKAAMPDKFNWRGFYKDTPIEHLTNWDAFPEEIPIQMVSRERTNPTWSISIKALTGTTYVVQNVDSTDNGLDLHMMLQDLSGIPAEQMRLVSSGKVLDYHSTLESMKVHPDTLLHLILKLRGD
eukprot:TRINITY_DN5852_c0_g1_i2.p1 TRINITY_DN5852_c0_g1~~TRINITY_DN5852_c0_g1_i2.p1  ORF type:complete len:237 (+),score=43.67 TRINITY_DN5852_c0_g1_i2:24-713(+)